MSTTPSSPTSPSVDPITVPPAGRPVGHAGARVTVTERSAFAVDGFLALLVGLVLVALAVWRIIVLATSGVSNPSASDITIIVVLTLLAALVFSAVVVIQPGQTKVCLLYTSPSPRDRTRSRMPSSA